MQKLPKFEANAQIAYSGPKSMIRDIEGRSIVYGFRTQQHSLQPYADKC